MAGRAGSGEEEYGRVDVDVEVKGLACDGVVLVLRVRVEERA